MKKQARYFAKVLLSLLIVAFFAVAMVACSNEEKPDSGQNSQDQGEVCNHIYGAWTVVTSPTCAKTGLRRATCNLCGQVKEEVLNTVSHTPEVRVGQEPTCTENGTTDEIYCSVCGEILQAADTAFAQGHEISGFEVVTLPTCTDGGVKRGTCSVCGQTVEVVIDALGHDLIHHDGKEATCTEHGWYEYDSCSRCDYTTFREIKPLRHEEVIDVRIEPTCEEYGWTEGSHCALCGVILVVAERIDPLGHAFDIVVDAGTTPTCTEVGNTQTLQCIRCYKVQDGETIPALGHDYDEDDKCTRCGEWNEHNEFDFVLNGDEYTLAGYHGGSAEVVIPAKYHGLPVTEIGIEAFYQKTVITNVTIPDSMKSIRQNAFDGCVNLVSISIPNSVTTIDTYVFRNCENLKSVTIGSGVTSIGYETFTNCPAISEVYYEGDVEGWCKIEGRGIGSLMLASSNKKFFVNGEELTGTLVIPVGVSVINGGAFAGCQGLTDVSIPDSVTSIGASAFSNCISLASITIPNSVSSIGRSAFSGCTSLAHASLPSGLTSMNGTFEKCTSLTAITLPESLADIGSYTFYGCTGLTSIVIPDGTNISGQGSAFSGCTGLSSITSNAENAYKIAMFCGAPEFSVTITSGAFATDREINNCSALTALTFGDSVTTIRGFNGCTNLTSISFGGNVDEIYSAFNGCTGLTDVSFPDSLTSITTAFANCSGIEEVILPDSVVDAYGSFKDCATLKKIVGSASATSDISKNTPSSAYSVVITSGDSIDDFQYRSGLVSITIPDCVTTIKYNAFKGCVGLRKITGNVSNVSQVAKTCGSLAYAIDVVSGTCINDEFKGCKGLMFAIIGDGVTTIGMNAFTSCSNLISVSLGKDVNFIDGYAFMGCNKLVEVCNNSSLELAIGSSANGYIAANSLQIVGDASESNLVIDDEGYVVYEDGCENALVGYFGRETQLVVPSYINRIYKYAFSYNMNLVSINIPNRVSAIGEYAFEYCAALKSIKIPANTTSIERGVFSNCVALRSVDICEALTTIGQFAFDYCSNLTSIVLPAKIVDINSTAFQGCYKLIEVYNKTSLNISGYLADYAKNIYTEDGGSKLSTDENGFVVYTDGDGKILIDYIGDEDNITLPENIKRIYNYALSGNKHISSITMPKNVIEIGTSAFLGCSNLSSVTLSDNLTSISSSAFEDCNLTSIVIPNSVTTIYNRAFYNNYGLKTVTIGSGMTNIASNAFANCTSVSAIYYMGDVAGWCAIPRFGELKQTSAQLYINGEKIVDKLIIPDGVTSIGEYAFAQCVDLVSVYIPNSVTLIKQYAFSLCPTLKTITFGGTQAEWNAIEKGIDWQPSYEYTIKCTDGDIVIGA